MKHIIFGGDGFLGTELAKKLIARGEKIVVCDLKKTLASGIYDSDLVTYIEMDVTDKSTFERVPISNDDIPYHFAAKLLVPILPRKQRQDYFWEALYQGTKNVLDFLEAHEIPKMIYYTTDMVYGHTVLNPRYEDHPCAPLGPYGDAKLATEKLCREFREKGFNITIFRPRLIIGPDRLGILGKLFKLVDWNLPVPTIGNGKNYYQFISVSDCANAVLCAVEKGIPNEEYNLGSAAPPQVNQLLKKLIKHANSKSFLLPTPAFLVKFVLAILDRLGIPLMDPEQYLIADETCVLDISKAERELSWVPKDCDEDMLIAAYDTYRTSK
jgi:dTDP-glucose 4,6-dehydratase